MRVIYNRWLPPGRRFAAINILGLCFIKRPHKPSESMLRHETIHSRQMLELGYVFFYLMYLLEWVWQLLRHRFNNFAAYKAISFEREAYAHQDDEYYLQHRKAYAQWRSAKNNI
ncbi:MAG: hypothetical protein K2M79_02620 [Muribaculaceae bacterium]|nr:hypothetical protein [Muribaculaceae bacterium]